MLLCQYRGWRGAGDQLRGPGRHRLQRQGHQASSAAAGLGLPLRVPGLHTIYTLSTQHLHTIYTVSTHYLHTIFKLSINYLHTIYTLLTH